MNNNSDKIFLIEKNPIRSSEDKFSLLQKNIALLSSMNQINQPNSASSLFQTSTAFHYTNQSFLNLKDNSFDYSLKQEHYTNSSFLLFPMFQGKIDDDDMQNIGMSFFTSESFKEIKTTQNYYMNDKKSEEVKRTPEKKKKIKKKRSIKRKNSKRLYQCEHTNCPLTFKTIKQKYNHHKKMCKECKKDTISMLRAINKLKQIYQSMKNKIEIPLSLRDKYNDVMGSKYLEGYAQLFVGMNIDECINDTEMNFNISSDYDKDI